MQALGLQHDLLIGLHMDHAGQIVGIGIIDDDAMSGKAAVFHVLFEPLQRAVLAGHKLRAQLVIAPAGAGAKILLGVQDHDATSEK